MLRSLTVQNYVLIDECVLEFVSGLCVLTGETGAGKSILLGALGLLLGERVTGQPLRDPQKPAVMAAEFDGSQEIADLLEESGVTAEDDGLLLKRMIQPDGKSRCFINDQPVGVALLKAVGERLVEVHGQHGQAALTDPATHRRMLDGFAGLRKDVAKLAAAYESWRAAEEKLRQVEAEIAQTRREEDYLRHVQAELAQLAPQPDEETELAAMRTRLMQAEKLGGLLAEALAELQGGGRPVEAVLHTAQRLLTKSELAQSDALQPAVEALERAQQEVAEALQQLERAGEDYGYDPKKLERTEERLFALRAAARKHQVAVAELPEVLAKVQAGLQALQSQEATLQALQQEVAAAKDEYRKLAESVSAKRQKAAEKLAKQVMAELKPLKMAATKLQVTVDALEEAQWGAQGTDRVRFEVSTNPGSPFGPLHKIASGGELSRFMLALKVVLAKGKEDTTLIFDEIDSGTSGAVADAVGERLAGLSETQQVLVITHLPQVASKGAVHFKVAKQQGKGSTRTVVAALDEAARREELAQMLSGKQITDEARQAADKLMEAV